MKLHVAASLVPMRRLATLAVLAGCGRLAFDPTGGADGPAGGDAAGERDFGAGCVVGLRMNEAAWTPGAASVVDACGGDNNGVPSGLAVPVDDPVRGRVGQFGGAQDCVVVADAAVLDLGSRATTSAWIFPVGLDQVTPRGVVAKRTDDNTNVAYTMFVWTGDHVVVDIETENDEAFGNVVLQNNRWQMITAVYDGGAPAAARVQIYVDGVLDRTAPETSAAMTSSPSPLAIGCLPQQPASIDQQSFAGRLDDVAVWNRAFTAADVMDWYSATRR